MILDSSISFTTVTGQAITATANSTNVIDLGVGRDLAYGAEGIVPKLAITTDSLFAAAGAGTLTISFQGSADNSAWTTYALSPTYTIAQLNAGSLIFPLANMRRLPGGALPRYYRLVFTVATGPFTAGTIFATWALELDGAHPYPSGFTVAN